MLFECFMAPGIYQVCFSSCDVAIILVPFVCEYRATQNIDGSPSILNLG